MSSSIVAAGVPRRGQLPLRFVSGALVVGVLAVTTALVAIHSEREPSKANGRSAPAWGLVAAAKAAPVDDAPAPPAPTPLLLPAPAAEADTPSRAAEAPSAPTKARAEAAAFAPVFAPASSSTTAPSALPATTKPTEAAFGAPRRPVDRSEVF
jgi:hypothetical protein